MPLSHSIKLKIIWQILFGKRINYTYRIKQYSAEVASARIQYQQSLEDYNRRVPLAKQGVISKETLEHTKDTLISSKAALNAAIQAYKANKALVMKHTIKPSATSR
ncbi:drug resistance MFS transporter, membrane fusion protein (MFP) subunit EmrK [Shigella boydii]|nr:drug resistance MFS transporter, membrane fusion protein (MFP) subunit EmrK [Shigella boydii]